MRRNEFRENRSPGAILLNMLIAAVSLFVNGFGIYLTIQANIGAAPWDVLNLGLLYKDHQHHAHESKQGGDLTHIQRHQHAGNGSTDVSAHDDPDSLIQAHHTCVYKANHHDCGGRGTSCPAQLAIAVNQAKK